MAARKTTRKPKHATPKATKATARKAPRTAGARGGAGKGAARGKKAAGTPAGKKPAPARRAAGKAAARSGGASGRGRAPLKSKRPALKARRPAKKVARVVPILRENPEGLKLARTIARVAQDKKASDVLIIDTRLRGAQVGYDYVVLASGDSDRQLTAIADAVAEALEPQGQIAHSVEASADWVLVNYTDVVAHFFTPDTRATYDLEGLWSDVPRVPLAT